jgi:hypothetical protein
VSLDPTAHGQLPAVRPEHEGDTVMTAPADLIQTETKPRSRRALLAGALGGLGAVAASAVARVSPVRAEGETMVVGGDYDTATSPTTLKNQTNANDVLRAISGPGTSLYASSDSGHAVFAHGTSGVGVEGTSLSGIGVQAVGTNNYALRAISTQATAGRLQTNSQFGAGVEVEVNHATNGRGAVEAYHKGSGPAVWATATNGYAVRGSGRLRFEKVSGVATIAAGSTSRTISPGVDVTSGSFVLLTPKANLGTRALWFTTDSTNNRFTVRMSSARSSSTKVAWLLLG